MVQTMGKRVATGAFAVLVAGTLSFPSLAFALESGNVGATEIANGTTSTGEGWSYDGADTISLNNYVGDAITTVGNTIVNLQGENTVTGDISVTDGDLTINGDTSVPAEEKPVLNMMGTDDDGEKYPAFISAHDSKDGRTSGDVTIEGATVNFTNSIGVVVSGGNVTIDNSYLGVADKEETGVHVSSSGNIDIVESVIDGGHGGVYANDSITIDNSDVTVLGSSEYELPYLIAAVNGITLKNMANGEVKQNPDGGYYVDTNDGKDVKLKASSTPGYYKGTAAASTKGMPQTNDSTSTLIIGASTAALAAAACMGFALRRKRNADEA